MLNLFSINGNGVKLQWEVHPFVPQPRSTLEAHAAPIPTYLPHRTLKNGFAGGRLMATGRGYTYARWCNEKSMSALSTSTLPSRWGLKRNTSGSHPLGAPPPWAARNLSLSRWDFLSLTILPSLAKWLQPKLPLQESGATSMTILILQDVAVQLPVAWPKMRPTHETLKDQTIVIREKEGPNIGGCTTQLPSTSSIAPKKPSHPPSAPHSTSIIT
ncbi:hypothetical protein Q8A73_006340 [Channa argus]|nr:hypothetical protein Q8A73_006340 [Channa argus]